VWLKISAGIGTEPGPVPQGEALTALVEAPAVAVERNPPSGMPAESAWWPEAREARRRSLAAAERGDTAAATQAASWLGGLVKAASIFTGETQESLHDQIKQQVPAGSVPPPVDPNAPLYAEGLVIDQQRPRRPPPPGYQKPVPAEPVVVEPVEPDTSPRVTRDPVSGELVTTPGAPVQVPPPVPFEGVGPPRSPGGRPLRSGAAVTVGPVVKGGGQ
jgi:hypothetical protein